MTTYNGKTVHLAVACDVFNGVFFGCPFSHAISWMRPGTKLSQFLGVFLPTFRCCKLSEEVILQMVEGNY